MNSKAIRKQLLAAVAMVLVAAVATIGSAFRNIFGTMKVCRTSAALSRTAQYFHIVNKIRFCHKSFLIFNNVFRDVFSSRLKNSAS